MSRPTRRSGLATSLAALCSVALSAEAGGRLDDVGPVSAPTRGQALLPDGVELRDLVPIFWDERCARVDFTLNAVPANLGFPDEIPVEALRGILQMSMDRWNAIPTSYIDMQITSVRRTDNGLPGLDFVNQLSFEMDLGPGVNGVSLPTTLTEDVEFVAGDDLDGDGDSDVYDPAVERQSRCTDIDGDGDLEFPAGRYRAGTILDNDVFFGAATRFEVEPGDPSKVDLVGTAIHEFGHAHGLSHSLVRDISDLDGSPATMYPFSFASDADYEQGLRDLHIDDIAWSSRIYPEGSGPGPLASLEAGDIAFADTFQVIRGSVTQTDGLGVLGANVYARTVDGANAIPVSSFAGAGRLAFDADLMVADGLLEDPALAPVFVADGDYELPLPVGIYRLFLQSPDDESANADNITNTATVGLLLGQHGFAEEGISSGDTDLEVDPGRARLEVLLEANEPGPIVDAVVNRTQSLSTFAAIPDQLVGLRPENRDVSFAGRFSNADVLPRLQSGATLTTALFSMLTTTPSAPIRIQRVALALGRIDDQGAATITNPLRSAADFVSAEGDFQPFYLPAAKAMSTRIRLLLERDSTLDVFLILEVPNDDRTTPGVLRPVVAAEADTPRGDSFVSLDGMPLTRINVNWAFQLNFTMPIVGE